jgi:cytochrome c biogenesis protein CcmG/thiol:disulfide interchange protein DsbE
MNPKGIRMPSNIPKGTQALRALALVAALFASPMLAVALDVGDAPPDVAMTTLAGKPISLASLRGKVALIDFWASWCAPCKEEMPFLESLHKKHGSSGLVIVGVSVDSDRGKADRFIRDLKVTFPIVHDEKHAVADQYEPPRMPTSFILDREGKVRFVHAGYHKDDAAKIAREVAQLLK